MTGDSHIKDIYASLRARKTGEAIDSLLALADLYPTAGIRERAKEAQSDYHRMVGSWAKGYDDPQVDKVHEELTRRVYALAADTALTMRTMKSSYLKDVAHEIGKSKTDISPATLKNELENIVAETALLQIEKGKKAINESARINTKRQRLMSDMFHSIFLSRQWTGNTARAYRDILLSPTVDSIEKQLLVSAVMMSAMFIFDINKLRMLIDVYTDSDDVRVRQRALVGWTLCLYKADCVMYPEIKTWTDTLIDSTDTQDELMSLQVQLINCVNTARDTDTMQREIMPDLLTCDMDTLMDIERGQDNGDSSVEDILNPNQEEEKMEAVQKHFGKMSKMMREGTDVAYPTFSHLKLHSFFNDLSNWFLPFYTEQPDVAHVFNDPDRSEIMMKLLKATNYCDSDKYSFVLAYDYMTGFLPGNIWKAANETATGALDLTEDPRTNDPADIRRRYLQDLYRFFQLAPCTDELDNPLDRDDPTAPYLFFASDLFKDTVLSERFGEIMPLLTKKEMYTDVYTLSCNYPDKLKDFSYHLYCGEYYLWQNGEAKVLPLLSSAIEHFEKALEERGDDRAALAGYARACFYDGAYNKAIQTYDRLLEQEPKLVWQLSHAICLTATGKHEEAIEEIYELYYKHPDDKKVLGVLARCLLEGGKYEKALDAYTSLQENDAKGGAICGAGYCLWLMGKRVRAADTFTRFLKQTKKIPAATKKKQTAAAIVKKFIIMNEKDLLQRKHISDIETEFMTELICEKIFK